MGNNLAVPKKLNMELPFDSIPREKKAHVHKKLVHECSVHISTIHNSQKVEKSQMSINWGMDKQNVVYPNIEEFYTALRINELSSHEKILRTLESILLSEIIHSEKTTYCIIPDI